MTKTEKLDIAKKVIRYVSTGLVELFTGALTATVLSNVSGGKISKVGAGIGGGLVGLMVGDKVGDYICDNVDEMVQAFDEMKEIIGED